MAFVDPERFKRFEQFVTRHILILADLATQAFEKVGPGALVYRAADDKFDAPIKGTRFEYKTKAQIDAAQAGVRDELLQGMLERYAPPGEAIFVAIYPDETYDVTRVVLRRSGDAPRPN